MDVDAFISGRTAGWDRLAELTARGTRRTRRGLTPDEVDELVERYLEVSSHLSLARSRFRDPDLTARLSDLVGRAGAVVYGTPPRTTAGIVEFFARTFPGAVWHLRHFVLVATAALVLPGIAVGAWIANSDAALEATGPAAVREAYVAEDFEQYYSSAPAAEFASGVFTNNARVGVLAFALGIGAGLPTLVVLAVNGANVGVAAGLFSAAGEPGRFWGLILPHGLLELTAVAVAGGTGLALGWALVDPGEQTRRDALAESGRRAVAVVVGLVPVFVIAGIVEGFVTGSTLPTSTRLGVGAIVWGAFVAWVVVLGRAATAEGRTGASGESDPLRVAFSGGRAEAGIAGGGSSPQSDPATFVSR